MRHAILGWLMVAAVLAGCRTSLPRKVYTAGDGARYCATLADTAEKEASTWSVLGWSVGVIGAAGVVGGPAMGPDEAMGASWLAKNRNVLVSAGGALLMATAKVLLDSSDASTNASAGATRELRARSEDAKAYDACMELRAAWTDARKDANSDVWKSLQELQKKVDEAAAEAKQAAGKAKQAGDEAEQAAGKAEQATGKAEQATDKAEQAADQAEQATGKRNQAALKPGDQPH